MKRKVLIMTAKANFTAEEWKLLCDAPLYVGGAVAVASPSGIVGTIKEGMTIVNSIRTSASRHPHNQLIQEVVPRGVSREQIDSWSTAARVLMQQSEAERIKMAGEEACRQVASVLQMKSTPQESEEFKRWLLEIGQEVATAANEGGNFMNQGGTAVSPEEVQMLRALAVDLQMSGRQQSL